MKQCQWKALNQHCGPDITGTQYTYGSCSGMSTLNTCGSPAVATSHFTPCPSHLLHIHVGPNLMHSLKIVRKPPKSAIIYLLGSHVKADLMQKHLQCKRCGQVKWNHTWK